MTAADIFAAVGFGTVTTVRAILNEMQRAGLVVVDIEHRARGGATKLYRRNPQVPDWP